jgi:mannan endo-1,4-beta-mannosidase
MPLRFRRVLGIAAGAAVLGSLCAAASVGAAGRPGNSASDLVPVSSLTATPAAPPKPAQARSAFPQPQQQPALTVPVTHAVVAAAVWASPAARASGWHSIPAGEAPASSLNAQPVGLAVTTTAPPAPSGFLTRNGSQLLLNGHPHQFTGVDAYELGTDWGINAGCGGMLTDAGLNAFFASLPPHSLVRSWFYQPMATNVQTGARDWRPLDRVVAAASSHGDYLIATLGDQGGVCDGSDYHDITWYEQGWRSEIDNAVGTRSELTTYKQWLSDVVGRYQASPAIGMWELINEPEASSCPAGSSSATCGQVRTCPDERSAEAALGGFLATASAQIRSLDPNHLISTGLGGSGVCGAQGPDFGPVQNAPAIDVFSYHDYGNDDTPLTPAISAAILSAQVDHKAIVAGEVGMLAGSETGCVTLAERAVMLGAKRTAQLNAGVNGFLIWNWVPDIRPTPSPCSYDLNAGDPYLAS